MAEFVGLSMRWRVCRGREGEDNVTLDTFAASIIRLDSTSRDFAANGKRKPKTRRMFALFELLKLSSWQSDWEMNFAASFRANMETKSTLREPGMANQIILLGFLMRYVELLEQSKPHFHSASEQLEPQAFLPTF